MSIRVLIEEPFPTVRLEAMLRQFERDRPEFELQLESLILAQNERWRQA